MIGSLLVRVEIDANIQSKPVLKKDITKTLLRIKRASRETDEHRINFVKAIMINLVIKFAKVINAPKDLAAKYPTQKDPILSYLSWQILTLLNFLQLGPLQKSFNTEVSRPLFSTASLQQHVKAPVREILSFKFCFQNSESLYSNSFKYSYAAISSSLSP